MLISRGITRKYKVSCEICSSKARRLALPDEAIRPRRAFLAAFAPGLPSKQGENLLCFTPCWILKASQRRRMDASIERFWQREVNLWMATHGCHLVGVSEQCVLSLEGYLRCKNDVQECVSHRSFSKVICKYSIKYKASIIATKFYDISSRSFSRAMCKKSIEQASSLQSSTIFQAGLFQG